MNIYTIRTHLNPRYYWWNWRNRADLRTYDVLSDHYLAATDEVARQVYLDAYRVVSTRLGFSHHFGPCWDACPVNLEEEWAAEEAARNAVTQDTP
jgi:hypothetical protein